MAEDCVGMRAKGTAVISWDRSAFSSSCHHFALVSFIHLHFSCLQPQSNFENQWSQPCHITGLEFYGEIYKAAQAHSRWLQPVQLAQQQQHESLYLGRYFQLSNIALWGTQQTGLAFPSYCTSGLLPCKAVQQDKERALQRWAVEAAWLDTLPSIEWISIQGLLKKTHHYLKEK